METDQNTTPVASGERPLEPLSQKKYIKLNTNLPRLMDDTEIKEVPYLKSLFQGRINRRNYLLGTLLMIFAPVVGLLMLFLNSFLFTPTETSNAPLSVGIQPRKFLPEPTVVIPYVITPLGLLFSVAGTIIGLPMLASLQVRRLQDLTINGSVAWFMLFLPLAPLFILFLLIWPGKPGANVYGLQPNASINVRKDIFKLYDNGI